MEGQNQIPTWKLVEACSESYAARTRMVSRAAPGAGLWDSNSGAALL